MQRLESDETVKKLESRMREIDRKRRDYYQYYSGNEWGNPRNYHLSPVSYTHLDVYKRQA